MRQFAAILIAFCLLPFIPKKKRGLGPALFLCGVILALIAGLAPIELWQSFAEIFTEWSSLETIIVVAQVGILGYLLKNYGILDRIVENLKRVFSSSKVIIMVLPAVMGLLSVPGGAYLSAPFADSVGEELGLPSARRAVVNLSFRHIAMFILPYTGTMIFIPTVVPGVDLYMLILLNIGFVICMQVISYIIYLSRAPRVRAPKQKGRGKALLMLLFDLSPVYMMVVLNIFGLPLYLGGFVCMALCFVIGCRKDFPRQLLKGLGLGTPLMMAGIYFLQHIIVRLDDVTAAVIHLFGVSSGFAVPLVISVASILFGATTGHIMVPLGVILPLVGALPIAVELKLVYTFFVFVWGFLGYYYSPLHLCQLLTVKYMGCKNWDVYKEHLKAMPFVAVSSYLLFYLYRFLLGV